ncbi:acyl-CoA desaturase [soil metagenome]
MAKISFNNKQTDFTLALKKSVEEYFTSRNIKQTGNWKLYVKTAIVIASAASMYYILLFVQPAAWISLILCALFGINLAVIGFNVMHDGAHGSYSEKKWVNEVMAFTLNLMGGSSMMWKMKHNVIHHTYTNIEGQDDDIDIKPFIRTNEHQKKYWFHKYQHVYFLLLYSLTWMWWIFQRDFSKYFTGKISGFKIRKLTPTEHFTFWFTKLLYVFIYLILPMYMVGIGEAILGYLVVALVCGVVLSIVFQLAHVVEDADFPMPNEETQKMDETWVIHQFATTADFSTRSKVMLWLTGGLNFQLEHHLFPKISHIHYPALHKVIQDLCKKYEVPIIEYPNLFRAMKSHVMYLRSIGSMA